MTCQQEGMQYEEDFNVDIIMISLRKDAGIHNGTVTGDDISFATRIVFPPSERYATVIKVSPPSPGYCLSLSIGGMSIPVFVRTHVLPRTRGVATEELTATFQARFSDTYLSSTYTFVLLP